jgi:hypothetical protein
MHRVFLAPIVVVVGGAAACASTAPVHRGASAQDIHTAAVSVVERDGYTCEASPDLSWRTCTHPEQTDFGFAYLPASNMLQVWSSFSRDDDGLHPRWRSGPCAPLSDDVAGINSETIVKLVCDDKSFRFEMSTWVPEHGLTDDDLRAYFGVFRDVIGETIQRRGFLPANSDAPASVDATAPSAAATAPGST